MGTAKFALRWPGIPPAVGTLQPKGGLLARFEATLRTVCLQIAHGLG